MCALLGVSRLFKSLYSVVNYWFFTITVSSYNTTLCGTEMDGTHWFR